VRVDPHTIHRQKAGELPDFALSFVTAAVDGRAERCHFQRDGHYTRRPVRIKRITCQPEPSSSGLPRGASGLVNAMNL